MTPDPFVLMLSRIQFGLTIGFHYIFVPLTLGLIVAVAIMDTLRVTTGRHDWRRAARFWYRFFVLAWLIGMATGYPLRMQLAQQWAGYSEHAREVIHAIMDVEGMIAPAMVSLVLASLAQGQPALDRAITRWLLAGVMLVQGTCIVTLNAWMQHPVGTEVGLGGAQIVSLREIFLSSTALAKVTHTLSAGMLTGAMFIAAISSWYLLRRQHRDIARISLTLALPMAAIALGAVIWSGHESARVVMQVQPMKFAAMEAHWERDTGPSPLTLLAWPDTALQSNQFAVTVPKLMSWLATHSDESPAGVRDLLTVNEERIGLALREGVGVGVDGEGWRQLHEGTAARRSDWKTLSPEAQVHVTALASVPSVPTLFAGFRLMVASAFLLAVVLGWALVLRRQVLDGSEQRPLRLLLLVLPLPWLATFAGWTVAEVGRQPWVIHEQLATASAARLQPAPSAVTELLIYFCAYGLLAMLFIAGYRAVLYAGPRRRLFSSAWKFHLRSLFGSRLQRRIAAAARASAWNGRPTPARPGRPVARPRHRPRHPSLRRS